MFKKIKRYLLVKRVQRSLCEYVSWPHTVSVGSNTLYVEVVNTKIGFTFDLSEYLTKSIKKAFREIYSLCQWGVLPG